MKKLFYFAFALLMGTASMQAQRNDYPSMHLGVRAGLSVNHMTGEDVSNLEWPTGGIAADFRLLKSQPLYFETGVNYMSKGYRDCGKSPFHLHCFNVPLLFSYHYYLTDKIAIQPFTGAMVGYIGELEGHNSYQRCEVAVRTGIGANYGRFYLNVGYDLGLTRHAVNYRDLLGGSSNQTRFRNNTFFVTFGFNFVGKQ